MCLAAARRVADVVVTIMAQRDVCHSPLAEMLYLAYVVLKSQTVLYAEDDAVTPAALVTVDIGRGARYGETRRGPAADILNLVEDKVGIRRRAVDSEIDTLAEPLPQFGLWKIADHLDSVNEPLVHLGQVIEDAAVTAQEIDTLGEEHRGVTV